MGRAIQEKIADGVIRRKDIFVTTKLGPTHWTLVKETLIGCLKRLQLDYIDLFMVHNPGALTCPPFNSIKDYIVYSQKSKELTPGKFHIWIAWVSKLVDYY